MANPTTEPATPDFYTYRWIVPASVEIVDGFVVLTWPDRLILRAYRLWLAENDLGRTIDGITREGVLDPADLSDDMALAGAELTASGALAVCWDDGHRSLYHPGWLRHVAEAQHRPAAHLPDPEPWTAADLGQPPTRDGSAVLEDPAVLEDWARDLARYGLARLTGVGTDPDLLATLGPRIGALRDTNFGPLWDVKADLEPNSTANTTIRLCPHTDLPTRETPPGFQFLHCVANTVDGGWSTMTDGLALVEHLADHHPDHYEALTTLPWVFFNRGRTVDHRWSGPIIERGDGRRPLTIRAFHPVRGFPDMADGDQPRAYAALRCFSRLAADPRFQLRTPFRPGDLVGFDNRRILHGRDAYEIDGPDEGSGQSGHRHLRGIYMDHDEVLSFLRVSSRRRDEST